MSLVVIIRHLEEDINIPTVYKEGLKIAAKLPIDVASAMMDILEERITLNVGTEEVNKLNNV